MVLFMTVLLSPHAQTHTHSHAHAHTPDYSQHAAEEINGSTVARPQVGSAWGGERSIRELRDTGQRLGGITDKGGGNQKLNHEDFQYICFRMFRRLGNNRWGE